jgi:hypothetical protein
MRAIGLTPAHDPAGRIRRSVGRFTTGVCYLWVARGPRLDRDTPTLLWPRVSACPDVGVLTGFRATVAGPAPGTYHVRVDDAPPGGPPVATAAVTVPGGHTGR